MRRINWIFYTQYAEFKKYTEKRKLKKEPKKKDENSGLLETLTRIKKSFYREFMSSLECKPDYAEK